MSKIRIYELAKELGVDNRVVISRAIELGLKGKSSHSHSLEDDEADQLRRAIIRQAIGTAPKSEVVTRRIDKVTGTADTVVESRSGNIIRRRKQSDSPSSEDSTHTEVEVAAPTVVEEVHSDNGAVQHEPAEIQLEEPVLVAPEPVEELVEPQVVEEVVAAPEEVEVVQSVAAAGVVVEEVRKPGPRVLGKIILPTRRVPVAKTDPKRAVATSATGVVRARVDEEEEEGGSKAKKRSKKREFSRGDLIDYDGRGVRRGPKPSLRKGGDDSDKKLADQVRPKAGKRVVKIGEVVTVGELARQMSLKVGDVIAKLMELGVMASINQALDQETATIIANEFEFQVESTSFDENIILEDLVSEDPAQLQIRPPVITVMGHVDHGKTSLLDAIRDASVAEREHGGITQHIGAYQVKLKDGRALTFIDTPGHAAFTTMRARGAKVTDIVVLVVAADDGVMPQTIEAISHAKAANVPIVVAVNKMDRPEANVEKVKQQLTEHGLQPEDWGGDTMYYPVSAIKKQGLQELLEGILLQADVKELKANPDSRARGVVIETRQDRGRGVVATVLVQNGTLRVSDVFVCGAAYGRVRSMLDHLGTRLESAGPAVPVEITGFSGIPFAGDDFFVVTSEAKAREVSSNRSEKIATKERLLAAGPISLEEFARRANNLEAAELNVILKADVHGSVEAVRDSLEKLSTEKVKVKVLHAGVGGISESDISLAIASKAVVVGFGVRAEPRAAADAESAGVDLRFYRIIYELIDDVKLAMAGLLEPIKKESPLGRAEVRSTFFVSKVGTVAGCAVTSGLVRRGAHVRLVRDSRVVHEGRLSSLKRFKDDAREVQNGYECGIAIEGYNDLKVGDALEFFEIQEIAASID